MLLRELLRGYTERYAEAKARESAVDFDDLELLTCRLLEENPALHERYRTQFEHILVDEFQDTNQLQIRLLGLLAGEDGRLFTVGDEFQSIYGFRHADVRVFREVRDTAAAQGRVRALRTNFRSRPEILDALNGAFAPHWDDDFEPLEPGGDEASAADQLQLDLNGSTPSDGAPAVELIVVDQATARWADAGDEPFGASLAGLAPWRAAEMRLLADRIRRLIDDGRAPDDIVVLLRAGVDMPFYERALRERGVETYVVGGRNYWTQQQVADLRAYLAVLANPLDEQALYSVLGSPLGGLSLDAIGLLGLGARRLRRDPWWALTAADGSDGLVESFPASDRERVPGLVAQVEEHRALAATVPLERLLDRVITDSRYDRTLLALPDGRRRMANVRKLMRLARRFEAEQGGDLRAFIDYLAEQDVLAAREGEAPLEAEDLHAVRLMTIHAAKGLEFPVVCVADLGRSGRGDDDALRVTDDGRVGLKIASMAGGSAKGLDLEAIQKDQEAEQDEEERRIFYVAMTRAQELLVLSGATDTEQWPAPRPLGVPMNWIWRGFAPGLDAGEPQGARSTVCTAGERRRPARRERRATAGRSSARTRPCLSRRSRSSSGSRPRPRCRSGGSRTPASRATARAATGSTSSASSGCASSSRCRGTSRSPSRRARTSSRRCFAGRSFTSCSSGSTSRPRSHPRPRTWRSGWARTARTPARRRSRTRAGSSPAFLGSPLFERLTAAQRVRKELAFAYELAPPEAGGRSLLVNGFVDVYAEEPERVLIVDYKTDSLEGTDPESLCDAQYSIQRLIYALAALRSGAPVVEVAYCFLEQPDAPARREWTAADAPALEQELVDLAGGRDRGPVRAGGGAAPPPLRAVRGPAEPLLVGPGRYLACTRRYARSVSAEPDQQPLPGVETAGIEGFPGPFAVGRYAREFRDRLRAMARVCIVGEVVNAQDRRERRERLLRAARRRRRDAAARCGATTSSAAACGRRTCATACRSSPPAGPTTTWAARARRRASRSASSICGSPARATCWSSSTACAASSPAEGLFEPQKQLAAAAACRARSAS